MIKAVFFAADRTFISHTQNAVPESTRTSLNQLPENGIQRVIATGRHMLELSLLPVKSLDFGAYITLNGQLCSDGETSCITQTTKKATEYILMMLSEKKSITGETFAIYNIHSRSRS